MVLALFGLSLWVRLPLFERPLGTSGSEWLTANVVRFLQIWSQEGAIKNRFCFNSNYPNPADKNIQNHSHDAYYKDRNGNYYYVSYPPFALIAPYAAFKLFGIYPDVIPLRIFGLFVHFLTALFVFLIADLLTRRRPSPPVNVAAILAFAFYVFSPGLIL
jgi:hypothetical protein